MVLTLMLELMVPTTLAKGLLMPSLRPRLMLLSSTELMDMLDMLIPLTPMDMLRMLDTPMLLDMLVHMVLLLMPILDTVLMVDTHTLMVHIPPMVLIPTMDKKENHLHSSKNNHNRTKKTTA